ncbi:MAG: ComEA family DNA-binding protein [Candidatus Binatia bacterium]
MKRLAAALFLAELVTLARPALAEEKINVNTATEAELMKLPGMNAARARAILNYRSGNGELIQLEELKLIPQVAPIYDELEDRLVLE